MKKFEVTIVERSLLDGQIHTIKRTMVCHKRAEVVEWYGLDDSSVLSYEIAETDLGEID